MKTKIIDPENYDPLEYTIGQNVLYKNGDDLIESIIVDIDYETGSVSVEFKNE